ETPDSPRTVACSSHRLTRARSLPASNREAPRTVQRAAFAAAGGARPHPTSRPVEPSQARSPNNRNQTQTSDRQPKSGEASAVAGRSEIDDERSLERSARLTANAARCKRAHPARISWISPFRPCVALWASQGREPGRGKPGRRPRAVSQGSAARFLGERSALS